MPFFTMMLTLTLLSSQPMGTLIEQLAGYLKDSGVTAAELEAIYSCRPLHDVVDEGLRHIQKAEKDIEKQRKHVRSSALLPTVTVWGRYRSDDKIYFYQQNNIAVGKDYITIGPDEHNKTQGDMSSWEIGGRMKFTLSNLVANPMSGRFIEQEISLEEQRAVLIDRISNTYFLIALIRAIKKRHVTVPSHILTDAEIAARTGNAWFISIGGNSMLTCDGERQ